MLGSVEVPPLEIVPGPLNKPTIDEYSLNAPMNDVTKI